MRDDVYPLLEYTTKTMAHDTLKRIMWRLREQGDSSKYYRLGEMKKAIYEEVGMDKRTVTKHIELLTEQGLIKRTSRYVFRDIGGVV